MKTLLVIAGVIAILTASFAFLGLLWMLSLALLGINIGFVDSILFGFLTKLLVAIFYLPVKLPKRPSHFPHQKG